MPNSFVDKFIDFTRESETPTSFWKWGAYAIVGATLRDNVYWTQRGHRICSNIYVLLNADSAVHRKSGPVKEADRLLTPIRHTKVIRGRGSIQAILEDLANSLMDKDTGKTIRGGSCLLIADELKSFFVEDGALVGIMTDVYEYKDTFDYKLRGAPFKVKGLCISLLAASNDEFLKTIFTGEAIYGGLLGRTFLVKADEYKPAYSLLETEEEEEANKLKFDPAPLISDLREIAKLNGKIRFNIDAKLVYDNWYNPLRESYKKKPDRMGVIQRLHTGVVKISVILAVAKRRELIVSKEDMEQAIDECVGLLPNYEGFSMQVGKSNEAVAGNYLLQELWSNGGTLSKRDFLSKFWSEVPAEILDKVVITLTGAGYIETSWIPGVNAEGFVMTKKCIEIFKKTQVIQ